MLFWILAGLAVFLVNIYLPAAIFLPAEGIAAHVGSRDNPPKSSAIVSRARRSLANMQENMPFFLTLGVLALVVDGTDMALAILGAKIFVFARIAFIALYLVAIPWTRSVAYLAGFAGCVMMAIALV